MSNTNNIPDIYKHELQLSIANLYSCFSTYNLREKIDACTCGCISAEDIELLYSKPLHELSAKDLEKYSRKALSTWGDEYDFRHFLPRLFEILAKNTYDLVDPEILFDKLNYSHWESWAATEQATIQEYFLSLWKYFLTNNVPEDYSYSGTYICAFARALDDVNPFLLIWQNIDYTLAYEHLDLFIEQNIDTLHKYELKNPFWNKRQKQMKAVVDWLLSPATTKHFKEKLIQSEGIRKEFIFNIIYKLENI